MISVKKFAFNPFQVNTYLLYDETAECVIIDAGMDGDFEETEITEYINNHNLKPVMLMLTHAHIDHIVGNNFIADTYSLPLTAHKDCVPFLTNATAYAATFGLTMDKVKNIDNYIDENKEIKFGNSKLKVLYTPGHANGSLCFYSPEDNFVITGDVLFNQSIGRTDLPTGNYDLLQQSIWEKLFALPDETVVYPGHGPDTSIGFEKVNNPFVAIGRE
ncbi:MAG: MBL fold metallo-hydrolase [Bacteroidetes bacterium]|nr:MBL fold metallo-hydrolase [Bacteroidota bacterium]MBL6943203.1 MBL fold metallo-hydrolase [Bacteroidales bacterium]